MRWRLKVRQALSCSPLCSRLAEGLGAGRQGSGPAPTAGGPAAALVLSECVLCRAGVWGQTTCAFPICTRQWLSSGVPVSPKDKCQRLEMLLCVPTGRYSQHLVGGSQGCCSGHGTAPNSDLAPLSMALVSQGLPSACRRALSPVPCTRSWLHTRQPPPL